MKNLFLSLSIIPLVFYVFSPGVQEGAQPDTLGINGNQNGDTVEYELVITDPEFELWYNQVKQPLSFYSERYLENWNSQLSRQWNTLIPDPRRSACMPGSYIDYDVNLRYGLELNHKLFYYFRYIHEKCRIFYNVPPRW